MKDKILDKITKSFKKQATDQPAQNEIGTADTAAETEEFELCVMCGKVTFIPVSMPIDWRDNYEVGCGQLCEECAKKHQKTVERENTLASAKIVQAVEQSKN